MTSYDHPQLYEKLQSYKKSPVLSHTSRDGDGDAFGDKVKTC